MPDISSHPGLIHGMCGLEGYWWVGVEAGSGYKNHKSFSGILWNQFAYLKVTAPYQILFCKCC